MSNWELVNASIDYKTRFGFEHMKKIVCLPNGREIEVPEHYNWMAMDESGLWFTYAGEQPRIMRSVSMWWGKNGMAIAKTNLFGPFEPGDWTTQLYDIT